MLHSRLHPLHGGHWIQSQPLHGLRLLIVPMSNFLLFLRNSGKVHGQYPQAGGGWLIFQVWVEHGGLRMHLYQDVLVLGRFEIVLLMRRVQGDGFSALLLKMQSLGL